MVPTSITDWISALSAVGGTLIAVVAAYLVYKQYLQPLAQEAEPDVAIDGTAASMNSKLVVFDTSKQRTLLKRLVYELYGVHGMFFLDSGR